MKEFTTQVEAVVAEDAEAREAKIKALVEGGKSREDAEAEVDGVSYVDFMLDGREMRAYKPNDGQLMFLLAAMGRGQTNDGRMSSVVNIMLECLRSSDRDYMESRLISRDPAKRLPPEQFEKVFEHLVEEWFRPPVSDSSEVV